MVNIYKNFYVHYSAFLIVLCFVLGGNRYTLGLTLLAVILHESGHLAVLLLCGGKPRKIVVHACGISIDTDGCDLSSKKMLFTALGGPVLSLALAGFFYFSPFYAVNFCIGIINLLPVFPLDGGRVMQILIAKNHGKKASRNIMKLSGILVGSIAIPIGIILFVRSGFNISPVLLGLFIFAESFNLPFSGQPRFILKKAVPGDLYLIPCDMSLRQAAELLSDSSIGAVVDENGSVLRLVTAKGLYNQLAQPHNEINFL